MEGGKAKGRVQVPTLGHGIGVIAGYPFSNPISLTWFNIKMAVIYASNSVLEKKVIKWIVQLPATYDTQHNPKHLTCQPFCSFYFQERSVIVRYVQCKELDLYQRNEKDVSTTVHNWTLRKNVTSLVLFYKRIVLNLVHFKNIAKIIIWWSKI